MIFGPVMSQDCGNGLTQGEVCNDFDLMTYGDFINTSCECAGTEYIPLECTKWFYFLSDNHSEGSDIYRIDFENEGAILTYLYSKPSPTHIAYNKDDGLLYLVSPDGSFQTLDISQSGEIESAGETVFPPTPLEQIVGAAFAPNGSLILSSSLMNRVYEWTLETNEIIDVGYVVIKGGDLWVDNTGVIHVASQTDSGTVFSLEPGQSVSGSQSIPPSVTGAAKSADGNFFTSHRGMSSLVYHTDIGNSEIPTFLDGEPFTFQKGDLASGCGDVFNNLACNYKLYYSHEEFEDEYSLYRLNLFNDGTANATLILSGLDETHIASTPDGDIIVMISDNGLLIYEELLGQAVEIAEIRTVENIPLTGFPGVAISPDGIIYAAHEASQQIYEIQASGIAIPYGPQIDVDGGDLVFIDENLFLINRSLSIMTNIETSEFIVLPLSEVNGAARLPNGNLVLANGNEEDLFYEFDFENEMIIRSFSSGLSLNHGDLAGICDVTNIIVDPLPGCSPLAVQEFIPGRNNDGSHINPSRLDPTQSLGEPEREDAMVFTSLGYGGSITFSLPIENLPGDDIEIVETSFNSNGCEEYPEYADVYYSQDGSVWTFGKTVCKSDPFINLSSSGLADYEIVNFLRIENNDSLSTSPDGFDLDGVVHLHCLNLEPETVSPAVPSHRKVSQTQQIELEVSPNPSSENQWIRITGLNESQAVLGIYDLSGRLLIQKTISNPSPNGQFKTVFNSTGLAPGVYVYTVRSEGNQSSVKVVIEP